MTDAELLAMFTHATLTAGMPPEKAVFRAYVALANYRNAVEDMEADDDGAD